MPVLWIVPEWIGSGDPLRSGARARIPNPGQPALADVPALASLGESVRLLLWPLWIGVAALVAGRQWRPLALAAIGVVWIALVAAMAQFGGFSGEPRYATPGAALIAIAGAVGLVAAADALARRTGTVARRSVAAALVLALTLAGVARLDLLSGVPAAQAHQWRLANDLRDAVGVAGGREGVMRCGTPYVGPLRGPLLAYRLDVVKEAVEPDLPPRPPGVVFRSAHRVGDRPTPAPTPVLGHVAAVGTWEVARACRVRKP